MRNLYPGYPSRQADKCDDFAESRDVYESNNLWQLLQNIESGAAAGNWLYRADLGGLCSSKSKICVGENAGQNTNVLQRQYREKCYGGHGT